MSKVIFSNPNSVEEIKSMAKVDMHCHTTISDGKHPPELMIKQAKKLNIGLSITDHNEISGSIKSCREMFAIPGIEITSSDAVDFLVYFYKPKDMEHFYGKYIKNYNLKSRVFNLRKLKWGTHELLDKTKEYNCVISLAHPWAIPPKNSHLYIERRGDLLKYIDAIEAVNSLLNSRKNLNASEWAKDLNMPATGASDAHNYKHLGEGLTASYASTREEFLNNIIKKKNIVVGSSLDGLNKLHAKISIIKRNLTW